MKISIAISLHYIPLTLLAIIVICLQDTAAQSKTDQNPLLSYPFHLYNEGDFFRVISEIRKLRQSTDPISPHLDLVYLDSLFRLDKQEKLQNEAKNLLEGESHPRKKDIRRLLSVSLLQTNKEKEAETIWLDCCSVDSVSTFPLSQKVRGQVNPDTAKTWSTFLPGSGFLLSDSYSKALVSFLINAAFISGTIHYANNDQPALAGLLLFFEFGWYFGGRNASYEAAVNYNKALVKSSQQEFIQTQLNTITIRN